MKLINVLLESYDSHDDENLSENEFAALAAAIEKELKDKAR